MNAITKLYQNYPELEPMNDKIKQALDELTACFAGGGKLLLCGNGGSCADCEHIAGELMKGYLLKRPLTAEEKQALQAAGDTGALAQKLQRGLPSLVLTGLPALSSAFLNDVDGSMIYAQQAFAYARKGDVMIGISTSGNARNVCMAAIAVKARGGRVIGFTGEGGGTLAQYADILLNVPVTETYRVQELHLPLYHALCAEVEDAMFGGAEKP